MTMVASVTFTVSSAHAVYRGGGSSGSGSGANGVNGGGNQATGHDRVCKNEGAATHNLNC